MSEPQPPARPPEPSSQPVVSLDGARTGDVTIGDMAGRDINKTTIVNQARLSPEERQAQRNRAALLGLVRRFWVEGVLHESLHQRVRIELGMQARPDSVEHPWHNIVRLPGQEPKPLAPDQPISAVFAQAGSRLLILGAPGGGKTTTLLTLAEQLLDAAESDDILPIPVVFQLSTWAVSKPKLADWLVTELKERYKVPPKVGKTWVEAGEILPLLDGLDEVGPGDAERAACVQVINAYLGEAGAQAVVCSRVTEYARLGAKLGLETAIEVRPLDPAQVEAYLARLGASLAGLRTAVAKDATLSELAASPLLLSVMALAYRDTPAADLVGQEQDLAYERLWADYVQNRLTLERGDAQSDPQRLRAWLIWLTRGMQAHSQQVFYIEYFQPSWLATYKQGRLLRNISCWIVGLVFSLSVGPVGFLFFGVLFGIALGLTTGLGFGIATGANDNIVLIETLVWDWRRAMRWQRIRSTLAFGLRISLSFGLLFGLAIVLQRSIDFGINSGLDFLGYGLVVGLILGLVFGLGIGLALLATNMLSYFEIKNTNQPNEGIRRTQRSMLIGGLGAALFFGLFLSLFLSLVGNLLEFRVVGPAGSIFGNLIGPLGGLVSGTILGLVGGMWGVGGAAVLKHLMLRIFLRFRCGAPWNFAAALDEAVSRTLMTRVGGGYRFYHRLLQEHFAEHEVSELPIAPILGPQMGGGAAGRRAQE